MYPVGMNCLKMLSLHEALILLLDIFINICNLSLKENKISTVPEFVDSFFSGINKIFFIFQLCQETNIYYEHFHHITIQPNTDIFSYLAKDFSENKNLTCRKCTTQSCQSLRTSYQETPIILLIQINRFSVSNLHGRPRKIIILLVFIKISGHLYEFYSQKRC